MAPSPAVHVVADARRLPFRDQTFDVVVSTEMLEHVLSPEQAVGEMWRVLRHGGKLVLTTRFLYPIHSQPADYWRFTRYGLEHLFRGWAVELIAPDVTDFGAARLVGEAALNRHGRWLRWPAKAVVRILHRALGLIQSRLPRNGGPVAACGYVVVARKMAAKRASR
jgi:SAM-dependent methyltransferase